MHTAAPKEITVRSPAAFLQRAAFVAIPGLTERRSSARLELRRSTYVPSMRKDGLVGLEQKPSSIAATSTG